MSFRQVFIDAGDGPKVRVVGDSVRILATGEETSAAYEIFEIRGPKESGPPPHFHAWSEAYFVTEGSIEVLVADRIVQASTGAFVNIPPGTVHHYRIVSDTAAFVVVTSPAGASGFFIDMDREAQGTTNIDQIIGIAQRHGVGVPPPTA